MSKVFAFLADGLEEVECLAVVDVLRRAGAEVTLVSVTGSREITGSHHIHFQADALFIIPPRRYAGNQYIKGS